MVPFDAIEDQFAALGSVRCVQLIPSGEVAPSVVAPLVTAAKTPAAAFHANANHEAAWGIVPRLDLCDHAVAAVLETATALPFMGTAQNALPFEAIAAQLAAPDGVLY